MRRSSLSRQPGRDTSAGTGDTPAPGLHFTRDEKHRLLSAAVTASADRFARRGHHKAAANLIWEIELHSMADDGRCHLPQKELQELLGWTDRKLKEVRDVVETLGWLQVIRGCGECGNPKYAATRVNWPTIAVCAQRADSNPQMQIAIRKCGKQSANADSNPQNCLNKERGRAFEFEFEKNLTPLKHSNSNSGPDPGAQELEFECLSSGDFSLGEELSKRTQVADSARRALRDPKWVMAAWERACELLDDLMPIELRSFAITAAWAARSDAKIENPGALFVRLVQRRAWRLPARHLGKRVKGHVPNKAEKLAWPLLVALGLEHAKRPVVEIDPDAAAIASRDKQVREATAFLAEKFSVR